MRGGMEAAAPAPAPAPARAPAPAPARAPAPAPAPAPADAALNVGSLTTEEMYRWAEGVASEEHFQASKAKIKAQMDKTKKRYGGDANWWETGAQRPMTNEETIYNNEFSDRMTAWHTDHPERVNEILPPVGYNDYNNNVITYEQFRDQYIKGRINQDPKFWENSEYSSGDGSIIGEGGGYEKPEEEEEEEEESEF